MLAKTEAVVIKSMKYRDTSKIVTFYTRQYGKLKGIAKGARRANNKFGSSLEPFSRVDLVVYKKENRDLHLVSQCDSIESFRRIPEDLDRISSGLSVLELVDQITHGEDEHAALFELLVETLLALNAAERNSQSLRRAFTLRCAALFGYTPALDVCSECGRSMLAGEDFALVGFQPASGAVVCTQCRRKTGPLPGMVTIEGATLNTLQRFLSLPMEQIPAITYTERTGNELDETLRLYFRYHFDQARELRSMKVFKSVTQK